MTNSVPRELSMIYDSERNITLIEVDEKWKFYRTDVRLKITN